MLVALGYLYLSIVALTSRIRVQSAHEDSIAILRESRSAVYTYWFEHIFFLVYYFGRTRMPMLMTPHGKTDRITRLAQAMNVRVAKGSLEGGGRHALVTLLDQLKAGASVAIPADGSRGPERKCKAGCFILAQETGKPIIPVTWKAMLQIKVPLRYGKMLLPLPFNSIEIRLGAPVMIDRHHQFADLEGIKTQLAGQLNRLSE